MVGLEEMIHEAGLETDQLENHIAPVNYQSSINNNLQTIDQLYGAVGIRRIKAGKYGERLYISSDLKRESHGKVRKRTGFISQKEAEEIVKTYQNFQAKKESNYLDDQIELFYLAKGLPKKSFEYEAKGKLAETIVHKIGKKQYTSALSLAKEFDLGDVYTTALKKQIEIPQTNEENKPILLMNDRIRMQYLRLIEQNVNNGRFKSAALLAEKAHLQYEYSQLREHQLSEIDIFLEQIKRPLTLEAIAKYKSKINADLELTQEFTSLFSSLDKPSFGVSVESKEIALQHAVKNNFTPAIIKRLLGDYLQIMAAEKQLDFYVKNKSYEDLKKARDLVLATNIAVFVDGRTFSRQDGVAELTKYINLYEEFYSGLEQIAKKRFTLFQYDRIVTKYRNLGLRLEKDHVGRYIKDLKQQNPSFFKSLFKGLKQKSTADNPLLASNVDPNLNI